MIGTSCFLDVLLSNKRTKREISDQLSGKSRYNRTTIFTKRNGFIMLGKRIFLPVFGQKRTKCEISGRFQEETLIR